MNSKTGFLIGGIAGFSGVALGALGTHLLKVNIGTEYQSTWKTAAEYHLFHALTILVVSVINELHPAKILRVTIWIFALGIILFSGSLYSMSLSHAKGLGAITPLGGLALLAGWLILILFFLSKKKTT